MTYVNAGHFIWHDLMSTDPEASLAFYTELFGYRCEEQDMGGVPYRKLHVGDHAAAGIVGLEPGGPPSHWMCYVSVPDLDAALEALNGNGGKVLHGPIEVPNTCRFAVSMDAQGAAITPMTVANPEPPPKQEDMRPGMVCWNELSTPDPDAALGFYQALCGWEDEPVDMGPTGIYHMQKVGDEQVGGIVRSPAEGAPPYWCPYLFTDDVDATTAQAESRGAQVVAPPTDIPDVGRFSCIIDPTGACVSLFTHAPNKC